MSGSSLTGAPYYIRPQVSASLSHWMEQWGSRVDWGIGWKYREQAGSILTYKSSEVLQLEVPEPPAWHHGCV